MVNSISIVKRIVHIIIIMIILKKNIIAPKKKNVQKNIVN